jgi:hypothetical protein
MRRLCFLAVLLALCLGECVGACSSDVPHEGGEHLAIPIDVAGCPSDDVGHDEVADTYQGFELVPPDPASGLICRYEPQGNIPQSEAGQLQRQSRLDTATATELVRSIRNLRLRPRGIAVPCSQVNPDTGVLVAIALSYRDQPNVALWYRTTGCVRLYNGRWLAVPAGNPAFSTFERVVNSLSPSR